MKLHRKFVFAILGVATLCVAMSSSALTLGRAKGTVFLGQALKLTVPVQMEMGEGASALCFEADVFYGDSRQDNSRVGVNSEPFAQSQSANVTVTAQGVVDEPVVTVYLRAGCDSKTTRRYVMLAELAANVMPTQTTSNLPSVTPKPRSAPLTQPLPLDRAVSLVPRPAKGAKAAILDADPKHLVEVGLIDKSRTSEGRRAHLKLAPLDLTHERDPMLKLSNELMLEQGEDPQKRALAVAMWRSLNATPQDVLVAENRRQALESDLKGLHDITVKNRQVLEELTGRLGKAESERYSNPLVYGLISAVILSCLAIVFVRSRTPRIGMMGTPWWRGDTARDRSEIAEFRDGDVSEPKHAGTQNGEAVDARLGAPMDGVIAPPTRGALDVDIDLCLVEAVENKPFSSSKEEKRNLNGPSTVVSRAAGHMDFMHSMSATLRSVNTKEMLDVRHQAEFFMTLGQHEEAVALLRESADASAAANPSVLLELLKILHTLGRKAEYDHYRSGFNAIFNGHVPAYADFHQSGSGLEAYPEVCRRIVALWPEDAISYIENGLVRTRKANAVQDFDLEAFRDLLMLHGVASRIASSSFDSGFVAFSASKTAPTFLASVGIEPDVEVDLDLSESHAGNLIDFDSSGWAPSPPTGNKRKAH